MGGAGKAFGVAAALVVLAALAGLDLYLRPDGAVAYAVPTMVPLSTVEQASLPSSVLLPVPYTDQAPLGNWAAGQHTCEEASLLMVDRYLRGDHSGSPLDASTAAQEINQITGWKPALDLTDVQLGQMAHQRLGWSFEVLAATPLNLKEQLALGRPLIVGVRTHGLGNPLYPGYRTHFEQPGWSVSHYLVVIGYDRSGWFILNDPGITRGQGYNISFAQLAHAIDDLDRAYPNLDQGRIMLVLAPAG